MASEALQLPQHSDSDSHVEESRQAVGGPLLRRMSLLGLGGALLLAACGLAALISRSPPQPHPRLRAASAATPSQLVAASKLQATDTFGEDDDLACLLKAPSPDDEDFEARAATLLEEGELQDEDIEHLLEDDGGHGDGSVDEITEDLARSLQMKVALPLVPATQGASKAAEPLRKLSGKQTLWKLFHEADASRNGVIEGMEFQALGRGLAARFGLEPGIYDQLYAGARESQNGPMNFGELGRFAPVLYIFSQADQDHNNILSGEELDTTGFALAQRLGWLHLRPAAFEGLVKEADKNGDEQFDPAEMRQFFIEARKYRLPPALHKLFVHMDKDHSDSLSGSELTSIPKWIQTRFRLRSSFLEGISKDELDRRDFRELVWKAWDGSPFRMVWPFRMILAFHHADKDKNAFVEGKELTFTTNLLHNVFWIGSSKLADIVKSVDSDADGRLDPHDFVQLVDEAKQQSPFGKMCPKMIHLFKMLDHNKDHLLDGKELKIWAMRMRHRFKATEEMYAKALASVDEDGDGKLGPEEFRHLLAALNDQRASEAGGVLLRTASQEVASASRVFKVKY